MSEFIARVEAIQAEALGEWLYERFHPASVIDLGANNGLYLLPFLRHDCEVFAVDAVPIVGSFLPKPHEQAQRFDLRYPYMPPHRFTLCLCLETMEHLHREYHDNLMCSIADCADVCLFSCAVPGQGGSYHHAERSHAEVVEMFAARGYGLHPLQEDMRAFLQTFTTERERGEVSGWIIDNSFLFVKRPPAD
jgi:hypothetical protein